MRNDECGSKRAIGNRDSGCRHRRICRHPLKSGSQILHPPTYRSRNSSKKIDCFTRARFLQCRFSVGRERDLKLRTMRFALDVMQFGRRLPDNVEGRHIRGQLLRAGTSVAANYRSACRGRSRADFIAKLGIAIEEADETQFWLDLVAASKLAPAGSEAGLRQEAHELVAILIQSQKTARANR
jgi:four helix bundle protein